MGAREVVVECGCRTVKLLVKQRLRFCAGACSLVSREQRNRRAMQNDFSAEIRCDKDCL